MSQVTVRNLVKRYGAYRAVNNVDLDIRKGEFVALLGPSGCGKTTTLRCIAGLEDISEGEIAMGGRVVSSPDFSLPPERREIGMVFQSYAIWPHMSVGQNVAFGLKMKGEAKAGIDAKVRRALSLVGLEKHMDRGASQLSGGQQQRVALARAIVLEPSILLFDEPLSNLDAKLRESMRMELRMLQQRLGLTSIYVTHDQQEAMVVADRIILMKDGEIDQIGTPRQIYDRPSSLFGAQFVGLTNIFDGVVTGNGSGTAIRLPSGLNLISADVGLSAGQHVRAVCRPEEVIVTTDPPDDVNSFQATVVANYFLGNISDLYLKFGDTDLRVQLSPPRDLSEGQEVWVRIPPDKMILVPH
ncbi:ABC transporter ATP-binding protein [Aquabacter sp. CN5-332]|uniref:ABC transporter ATP-binding protein n=1 Tax=Aquabacter sp. CN5-332 TaxID=3156608 RepID=UPI0032B3C0DD